jgi:hypothetical protein
MSSTSGDHNSYWASKDANKVVEVCMHKSNLWYNNMHYNGYLYKLRDMWMSYYGANFASLSSTHKITFAGEQGELAQISINHLHNLCNHILTMVTSNRPVLQARASNKDYKSLVQTKLANQLLDYYMREKRLEKYLRDATEMAIVIASGYIKMSWNATSGEIYDYTEDGAPVYEGDVEFTNLSPFDVVFDGSKETDKDHDWVIVRTFKNRFDLSAKYPELADKIKGIPSKSELYNFKFEASLSDETDDIAVYELYHKKTEAMPQGRYMFFCDTNIVFEDTPMPYRQIPVFRISPAIIMGTPYGYTSMFDILPIQDAIDSLYSTILTNQYAFGVQNIYIPRGADVSMKSLEGGLNIIEGNANAGKPEALNLTQTPPEIFNFLKMLEQAQETISGVNSVARGNPEASLKSGTALALVQSMALQYISGLQQQYIRLVEDVGTALIMMLKDFASVPRVAMIAGNDNKSYVAKEFSGDDLSQVNRIIVDVGNPLSQTTAGKVQMAENLIQYGVITSPKEYLMVLQTGRLDLMTGDEEREYLLINAENEALAEGKPVIAMDIDQHTEHIKQHRAVLADPTLRHDPKFRQDVLEHISQHIQLLRTVDPSLLAILGEHPLPPVGGTPPNPQNPNQAINTSGGAPGNSAPMQGPPAGPQGPGMPNMPAPPSPFNKLPISMPPSGFPQMMPKG